MTVKKKFNFKNYKLWWIDFNYTCNSIIKFKYINNINIIHIQKQDSIIFFLYLIKNIQSLFFYLLDFSKNFEKIKSLSQVYINFQSIFYSFSFLLYFYYTNFLYSISSIFNGSLWLEREFSERYAINFLNIKDSRKLLYSYNYNKDLYFTNYNHIISDIYI